MSDVAGLQTLPAQQVLQSSEVRDMAYLECVLCVSV